MTAQRKHDRRKLLIHIADCLERNPLGMSVSELQRESKKDGWNVNRHYLAGFMEALELQGVVRSRNVGVALVFTWGDDRPAIWRSTNGTNAEVHADFNNVVYGD
jgi:hypothetical protein